MLLLEDVMIKLDRILKNIPRTPMVIVLFLLATTALAHCDTLDGPVVVSARKELHSSNITPALAWIRRDDEPEIRGLFSQVLTVRKAGGDPRELVDHLFFENLLRVHRAGEGAPYTGLKPAGQIKPPVALADKAIAKGNINEISGVITKRVEEACSNNSGI